MIINEIIDFLESFRYRKVTQILPYEVRAGIRDILYKYFKCGTIVDFTMTNNYVNHFTFSFMTFMKLETYTVIIDSEGLIKINQVERS